MLWVRERPPLRLHASIAATNGYTYRWGADALAPKDAPNSLSFSSTMPGGYENCGLTLARSPKLDYPDLGEFSTLTVMGAGGRIAWQGRIETTPRTSGNEFSVAPGAVGWQAALDDEQSAREIFVDRDLSHWSGMPIQRQLNWLSSAGPTDGSVTTDPGGAPALATSLTGAWAQSVVSEMWYDAQSIPLGEIAFTYLNHGGLTTGDTNWAAHGYLLDDDIATADDSTADLRPNSGPLNVSLSTSVNTRVFAAVQLFYNVAAGAEGAVYPIYWRNMQVIGRHGLTLRSDATGLFGLLASDIVRYVVNKYAPALATTFGGMSTIDDTAFIIPHIAFLDPVKPGDMIKEATQYEFLDWAVWDGPTFWLNARNARGKAWRARVGPSGLQESGEQVDRMWNGVVVSYTDTAGVTRNVGPPGSAAHQVSESLVDSDPLNPCNLAGITRWQALSIGTSTAAGAISYGAYFLAQERLLSTAGQAKLVGYVEDEHGVIHPAWAVRAGDNITFVDSHDPVPRRVSKASYDDASKSVTVDLDSPPEGLQPLLARLNEAVLNIV